MKVYFWAKVKLTSFMPPPLVSSMFFLVFPYSSPPFSLLLLPSLPLLCCHFSPSGETDWKVLVIDVADPLAPKMNGEGMKLGRGLRMQGVVDLILSFFLRYQ